MHPVIRLGKLLLQLGAVEGRKKFQKMVHILQVLGAPFPERFELSHFGAYSSELRAELDAMRLESLLIEERTMFGSYEGYSLKPGTSLEELFSELRLSVDDPWTGLAKELNEEPASLLEGVSTVLYLHQRDWEGDALKARFDALKPHLSSNFDEYQQRADKLLQVSFPEEF